MITLTVKEALYIPHDTKEHRLYMIREGNTIFYVGQSVAPLNRIRDHVGMIGTYINIYGLDQLGECIYYNSSYSKNWTVELLTLDDCMELAMQYETCCEETYKTDRQLAMEFC